MKKILLLGIILLTSPLFAQVRVSTALDNPTTTVGVENTYTVEITSDTPDFKVKELDKTFFSEESESIPLYNITNTDVRDYHENGLFIRTLTYNIVYFMVGVYELPQLFVYDAQENLIDYDVPRIEVTSVSKEEDTFADIEPPFSRSGNYTRIIILVLTLVVLAVLIFFLVRFILSRISKEAPQLVVIPAERFMEAYQSLQEKELLEQNKVEEYCTEFSFIFRHFLDDRFRMGALDLTTDEIYNSASSFGIEPDVAAEMKQLMYLWDLAKFAELRPSSEIIESNGSVALKLVAQLDRREE
ncbi:MAG: hypothetical protein PF637_07160 [Spirochaetes bacterium]|jgi:hypothetical protein|nr:hypothetical protein [Spirochaetota bacterium]